MTNSEYFEKNKISFAESMEIFNEQKNKKGGTKSFDKFLASEHVEHKFKVGDIVVLQLNAEAKDLKWKHKIVLEVVDICNVDTENCYTVKCLTPNDPEGPFIGDVREFTIEFVDRNCVLY